jgi:hypothetical protein
MLKSYGTDFDAPDAHFHKLSLKWFSGSMIWKSKILLDCKELKTQTELNPSKNRSVL